MTRISYSRIASSHICLCFSNRHAFCGFRKERKGKPGPVADGVNPLQDVVCETVAKTDVL
jgi:hypothetical protein